MKTIILISTWPNRREIGMLELHGVRIARPDGSVRIPVDANRHPIPFSFRCWPPNCFSAASIERIVGEVSLGMCVGTAGEGEWRDNAPEAP
jgi:hypothetical protein